MHPGTHQTATPPEYSRTVYVSVSPAALAEQLAKLGHPVELRPGQRLPTPAEHRKAQEEAGQVHHFPGTWEITPEAADRWLRRHEDEGPGPGILWALSDGGRDEWGLFLSDLDAWMALRRLDAKCLLPKCFEGRLPPLEEYLRVGREDWGSLSGPIRAAIATGQISVRECPAAATAAGYWTYRDRAIRALGEEFSPAEIAGLDLGDVDQEEGQVRRGGRWVPLAEDPFYHVDSWMDLRPELVPDEPLFMSQEGRRISARQVQSILKRGRERREETAA